MFNAARMPLGRMAERISVFIRGKHKPNYSPLTCDQGDRCVIVNADNIKMNGRRKLVKLYRHHTGFPGGLKEKTFKEL